MIKEQTAFGAVVAQILKAEGGYVHSEYDPGGETKYGISKRAYPDLAIADLSKTDAARIYYRDYWRAIQGDALPLPVALLVMDHAVNAGNVAAVRMLQSLVGTKPDGAMGPLTVRATQSVYGQHGADLLKWYSRDRIIFYARLPGWVHWSRGWTQRTQEALILATQWGLALAMLGLEAEADARLGSEVAAREIAASK